MALTAHEVENALEAREDFSWDELDWELNSRYSGKKETTLTVDGVDYPLSIVESDTGGEGHGEYVFVVIQVGDQMFRKEGWYASHYGTEWDGDFEEVEQYQQQVNAYRPV